MSQKILLNGNVHFDQNNNALVVLNENNRVVKLNQPVSRCLGILIEQYPAVVKQADLFHYIWGNEASQIPANALYQNISLLRRSLANASPTLTDVVITVPRAGFRLSAEVQITTDTASNEEVGATNISSGHVQGLAEEPSSTTVNKPKSAPGIALYIICAMVASFVLIWTYLHTSQENSRNLFDTYTLATERNGCKIYAYPDFVQNNQAEFNDYFRKFNITCKVLTHAYLSVNTPRTRVSVIYCNDILARAKTCVTHIYWNDSK